MGLAGPRANGDVELALPRARDPVHLVLEAADVLALLPELRLRDEEGEVHLPVVCPLHLRAHVVLARRYYAGIFLVYGNTASELPRWLSQKIKKLGSSSRGQILVSWHKSLHERAELVGRIDPRALVDSATLRLP